jgi:AbrB family looped-hinge helix DNA binding protein
MEPVPKSHEVRHLHLDSAGRVLIPASLRQQYGLGAGDAVVLEASESGLLLRPLDAVLRDVQAYFADVAPTDALLSEELIRERREEAAREDRD